jgi:hypothetical protein
MALPMPEPQKVPILKSFAPDFDKWLKEQRKGKKTIVIVGFAPTSRDLPPYDDPDVEIWGLNEAYRHDFMIDGEGNFRADKWFQIHKPWSYKRPQNRNHPNHWLWLQNKSGECNLCYGMGVYPQDTDRICKECDEGIYTPKDRKDFPIYMQTVDPDVPGSVALPLRESIDTFLTGHMYHGNEPIEYFTSSFAYMAILAAYLNQEEMEAGNLRLEVYGFEMSTETEYHYQKGSTEFWIGFLRGKGVDIFLPHHCQLLKGAKYGYEVTQMINRQELEFRKRQLEELEQQKVAALNSVSGQRQKQEADIQKLSNRINKIKAKEKLTKRDEGRLEVMEEDFKSKMKDRQELMSLEINSLSEANAVGGAMQEIRALIAYIDAQYNFADAEMPARVPEPTIQQHKVPEPKAPEEESEDVEGKEAPEK